MMILSEAASPQLDLHCPQCGYNLRGIESGQCPECGLAVDRAAFAESQLPGSHRRRIGYIRGYLRTLAMSVLDSRQLAAEVARPVSFRDAQKFRFITIFLAWIPLAAIAVWQRAIVVEQFQPVMKGGTMALPPGLALWWPWLIGALTPGIAPLALAVMLLLLSGVASYYFHPKSVSVPLQNRAIALSYYASAPLVLLPIAVGLALLGVQLHELFWAKRIGFSLVAGVSIVAILFPVLSLVGWWLTTLRLHRRIVHQYGGGSILLALTLPLVWVLCIAFALGGFIWTIGYFVLVIRSFS
jgi:hypothetical protein